MLSSKGPTTLRQLLLRCGRGIGTGGEESRGAGEEDRRGSLLIPAGHGVQRGWSGPVRGQGTKGGDGAAMQALGASSAASAAGWPASTGGKGDGGGEMIRGWARGVPVSKRDKTLCPEQGYPFPFEEDRGLAQHGAWEHGVVTGWGVLRAGDRPVGFVELSDGGSDVQLDARNLSDGLRKELEDGELRGRQVGLRVWYGDGGHGKRWADLVRLREEEEED